MTAQGSTADRFALTGALLLLLAAAPACVASSRHQEVVAQRDRLAKENLELKRALAEAKVRAEEAAEALARGPGTGSAPAPLPAASDPAVARTAAPPVEIPSGTLAPADAGIEDSDIRPATPPSGTDAGADGILKVARSYGKSGKNREALDAYTRLIQDYPFSPLLPEAFLERGRTRLLTGDREGALEDFDTVLEAFPKSREAPEARRLAASLRQP